MQSIGENINLEELNERISKIFGIKQIKHISLGNKITGVKFNLNQSSKDLNYMIVELLNLYIARAFVLPSDQKNKDVSVRIGNRQETFIVKRYIKQNDTYIESTKLAWQKSSEGWFKKAKNVAQNFINGKEEIEFIEINKDNLNFQISSNENTEVAITFAASETNGERGENILNCVSKFKELINNNKIKSLIEVDCNHPVSESQNKLNIYPFFAKKIIRDIKDNIKSQETVLCLTTKQNDVELASSIFRDNAEQAEIEYKGNKYSLLSYDLNNSFSQNLADFLLFFNDPSCNGEAQISNLQRIAKVFSKNTKIKDDQEKNSGKEAKIRIENTTCFTSSLHYEGGNLQLKRLGSKEKIYFNFEVRVENDLGQIERESYHIYRAVIYKITSLISFFDLLLNKDTFSILIEVDGEKTHSIKRSFMNKTVAKINALFDVKYYTECLDKNISMQLNNLGLFYTKKVKFKLEAEAKKIAIDRLKDIEDLINGVSILDSCKKEFLDNINNPVYCYLSNFFYEGNNLSYIYVITHPENLSINGKLLDNESTINLLQNELQKSFKCISNNFKQIQKEENFSVYSVQLNINELLSQPTNKPQEEEATEVKEEAKTTEEKVKAEPQKRIEYDVDWQEKCFAEIIPANDYISLEKGLKKACEFVHNIVLHVCGQLLERINTLQRGKEQKAEQDDQFFVDESILDDNIRNFYKFIDEKVREFKAIKSNLNVVQRSTITSIENNTLNAVQYYKEVVNIYLFINKNANDLQKILEKNVEELEQLILDVQMSKISQMIAEINKSAEESTQPDSTIQQTGASDVAICSTEGSQGAESGNAEKGSIQKSNSPSTTNSSGQASCIEEDEEVENEVTLEYVLELFNKLNKKSIEWYNSEVEFWLISTIDQGFGESEGEDDFDLLKSITTPEIDTSRPQIYDTWNEQVNCFLHQFELKIQKCINVKRQNSDGKQIETITLDQYKQILNLVDNIFYSAKILYYYKIQDGFEKLEKEIHDITGITRDYLQKELDEKEEELKIREAQLEQEINVRKIGSKIIVSVTQGIVSVCKKVKNQTSNPQQPQNPNPQNTEYSSESFYHQNSYNTNNYSHQQPDYSQYNIEHHSKIITQSNNPTIHSTYNHKRSNLQKLKVGIKDAFSEKENYAFLVFIIVGASGTLAYFVPEGLRKFVPSEKLNTIDITVAIGAALLIAIGVAVLAYSVYANIVYSNMTDPTASSRNVQSLNS